MAGIVDTPPRKMPDEARRLLLHRLPEPPIAHAYHHWDPEQRILTYTYNGRRLLTLRIGGTGRVSFRHGSDGALQSAPFCQQIFVMLVGHAAPATATLQLSAEALNMRPQRAAREQAVLGQVGRPLLPGVNGLYDVEQDLLISWHGRPWQWQAAALEPDGEGNLVATLHVELGTEVWVVAVRPHYYRTHLGYHYHTPWCRRPDPRPVAGWCTWEAYRRNVTESDVVKGAAFLARLRPYGLEYIQVDDGYERMPFPADLDKSIGANWLDTRAEFPSGHAGLVARLRSLGFQPGIWFTACCHNDAWADRNPTHLLKDADGSLLIGDWAKYTLDCTRPAIDEQVRPCLRGFREAGYTYVKIDGIRHMLYDGLHEAVLRGVLTNDEAQRRFRQFLEAGREELGDATYWLASWGVLSEVVGLCDACRIAQDAKPEWSGMQMQIVESARWFFAQRILFTNDPDHVCARAPLEWTRSVLSLVALSGGLYMLSDPIAAYDADRVRIAQQTLPPLATFTAETGPLDLRHAAFAWTKPHGFDFAVGPDRAVAEPRLSSEREAYDMAGRWETLDADHPFSTLWAIHLVSAGAAWCVAARIASLPLCAARLRLEQLALDAEAEYLVFDFWPQRFVGRVRAALDCPALELGHCQVLALRRALDRPQLLSSSRHVSQDAVSVRAQQWHAGTLVLELEGVRDSRETYWVHVPPGWRLAGVTGDGVAGIVGDVQEVGTDAAAAIRLTFPAADTDRVIGRIALQFDPPTPTEGSAG